MSKFQPRVQAASGAAHIHSPAGGQGLDQGFGGAAALARLLLPVLRGEANATGLDAYGSARLEKRHD
ncbi:FAD-dependent monooxygenase [Labrys sp. KB_33_2]|uniref:FAD-dependent monooxygenase n=1 Tax=Labrys sp. KB_33_2 TaxID=3237479 RepID=UPI003F8DC28E